MFEEHDLDDDATLDRLLAETSNGSLNVPAPQAPADEPPAPVAPEASATPPAAPAGTPERPREWNPDGPGNPAEALRQERERNKQLTARLAEFEAQEAQK